MTDKVTNAQFNTTTNTNEDYWTQWSDEVNGSSLQEKVKLLRRGIRQLNQEKRDLYAVIRTMSHLLDELSGATLKQYEETHTTEGAGNSESDV